MSQAPSPSAPRTGGQLLVGQLVSHGVKHVFCVPGESFLAVLDALVDVNIDVTVCRQEGGAAMMAAAQGQLNGEPGICMVTRGPGASNALAGIHIAKQDSTPLIVFVGQIERGMREREAFQEMDYRAVFGTAAKWATEIDDAARIPEILSRAFHVATSGRPGPVVIALPEDMLVELATKPDAPRYEAVDSAPTKGQMAELAARLAKAKAPVAILGGTRWNAQAVNEFATFAERCKLPVAVSFRRQMLFPATHPCFIGDVGIGLNPALLKRVAEADLVLLVGGRMSEMPSQAYTLFDIPVPKQALVHVHPDSGELGRVYRASLAINASPISFASELASVATPASQPWAADTPAMHQSYLDWSDPAPIQTPASAAELGALLEERALEMLGERAIKLDFPARLAIFGDPGAERRADFPPREEGESTSDEEAATVTDDAPASEVVPEPVSEAVAALMQSLGAQAGDGYRMDDVRLARAARLALVLLDGEFEGALHLLDAVGWEVPGRLLEQFARASRQRFRDDHRARSVLRRPTTGRWGPAGRHRAARARP